MYKLFVDVNEVGNGERGFINPIYRRLQNSHR
jgi:hypothetical protein